MFSHKTLETEYQFKNMNKDCQNYQQKSLNFFRY
jgi:hypothetical protein